MVSYRPGYTSQHKQHQWQKTGHKVNKSFNKPRLTKNAFSFSSVEIDICPGSCMGQQVQGWAQEEKIW